MNISKLKKIFIEYFVSNNHIHYNPASIIPETTNDTLFTVAGMQQFTNYFKDPSIIKDKNIVTIQPCIRLGGKHNDLDNIGRTLRHNTFFEMMGFFSFYDYGKARAIELAWLFLTQVLKLNKKYLYVSVYSQDVESYNIWNKYIDKRRIVYTDENLWSAGDNGLYGPCTEIFYDTLELNFNQKFASDFNKDISDFLEVWNLVFISFDKQQDNVKKLEKICVDTGMGLERIMSILNHTFSNYSLKKMTTIIEKLPTTLSIQKKRMVADHLQTAMILMHYGVNPGPNERSYILRTLLRRIYYTKVDIGSMVKVMYGNLDFSFQYKVEYYQNIIINEYNKCKNILLKMPGYLHENITTNELVNLHTTHGMSMAITREYMIDVYGKYYDNKEIDKHIYRHQSISTNVHNVDFSIITKEAFYDHESVCTDVIGLFDSYGTARESLYNEGGIVITSNTCFYPRSGGQSGDRGTLLLNDQYYDIIDTTYQNYKNGKIILHHMKNVTISVGNSVIMTIDIHIRKAHTRSHTATHLLADFIKYNYQGAQMGSRVKADEFTFDTNVDIKSCVDKIEEYIISCINKSIDSEISIMKKHQVHQKMFVQNYKYGDDIRVVKFGTLSEQLCCGTHVKNTSEIQGFKIISIKTIGSNVYRVLAYTGAKAILAQKKTQLSTDTTIKQVPPIIHHTVYGKLVVYNMYTNKAFNKICSKNVSSMIMNIHGSNRVNIRVKQWPIHVIKELQDRFHLKGHVSLTNSYLGSNTANVDDLINYLVSTQYTNLLQ